MDLKIPEVPEDSFKMSGLFLLWKPTHESSKAVCLPYFHTSRLREWLNSRQYQQANLHPHHVTIYHHERAHEIADSFKI